MINKIKTKTFILICLFTTILCVGCGVDNKKTTSEIETDIKKEINFENMKKGNYKDLKHFFKLNMNDYDGVIYYIPKTNMDVNEVLIIKVKDKSQIDSLEDSVDDRVSSQLQSFSGYGPKQCALINDYELKTKGNFLFFAIGDNAEEIKEVFLQSIQE